MKCMALTNLIVPGVGPVDRGAVVEVSAPVPGMLEELKTENSKLKTGIGDGWGSGDADAANPVPPNQRPEVADPDHGALPDGPFDGMTAAQIRDWCAKMGVQVAPHATKAELVKLAEGAREMLTGKPARS